MEWTFFDDPAEFLRVAGDRLAADPVVRSVTARVTTRIATQAEAGSPPPEWMWWAVVRDGAEIVSEAMRTATFEPRPLFLHPMPGEAALALARTLHERGEFAGGCNGALPAAQILADETARLWRGTSEVAMHLRLFECTEVLWPREVPGTLRPAGLEDLGLVKCWVQRFGAEADEQARRPSGSHAETTVTEDDLVDRISHQVYWLLEPPDGEVVHMTGRHPAAYGVSTIAPVFTPKEHRGNGYASHVVARLTQDGLDEGSRMCLYTDQANPTSNKIYQALGYRAVVDQANLRVNRDD